MRSGKPLRVTAGNVRRLKRMQRGSSDPRVVRRATVLVMLAQGVRVKEVSRLTGLTRRAIEKIRARWYRSGCESLVDRPRSGRPPDADPAFRREMVRTVIASPLKWGYAFTVWTAGRLAEHLGRKTGVRLSARRITQLLKAEGFSFGAPAHTLKGKRPEKAHREARKRLKKLKKGLSGPILVIASALETKAASTSTPT